MILGVVGTGIANILFFKLIQISSPVLHFGNLFDTGCSFLWVYDEMLTAIQFLERLSFSRRLFIKKIVSLALN
jgi:zinc transporter ZupT